MLNCISVKRNFQGEGGQILIINIAFSLLLALIIIGSLKHTQLSKVQSAKQSFLSLLFLCILSMSQHIYTSRTGHQGIHIFSHK